MVLLALALLVAPAVTSAMEADRTRLQDTAVFAVFTHSDGCIITTAAFSAGVGKLFNANPDFVTTNVVNVAVTQADTCTGLVLMSAAGWTKDFQYQIDSNFDTPSAAASVPVFDMINIVDFTMTVNINWTGYGAVLQGASTIASHLPGFPPENYVNHVTGWWRNATAVGTISDGVVNYAPSVSSMASSLANWSLITRCNRSC